MIDLLASECRMFTAVFINCILNVLIQFSYFIIKDFISNQLSSTGNCRSVRRRLQDVYMEMEGEHVKYLLNIQIKFRLVIFFSRRM